MYSTIESTFDIYEENDNGGIEFESEKSGDTISVEIELDFNKIEDSDSKAFEIDKNATFETIKTKCESNKYECK